MSDNVHSHRQDGVLTLTLSRVEKKNALTSDMYAALADALLAYAEDADTRALVITGEGDMFTAGNDLNDFATGAGAEETPAVIRFLNAIRDCPKPVIAAVNGHAIGVGLTMLLHCDLVYASEAASFSAPFVKLGLVPEAGSSMLLPAAVGMAVANDILLAGRQLNADEALRHGLVSRIFPARELADAVQGIARGVADSAPAALRHSKALIRHQRDQVAQQMQNEGSLFAAQLQSAEFSESISAMIEKRPARYR